MISFPRILFSFVVATAFAASLGHAAEPAPTTMPAGAKDFFQGLDALAESKWPEAADAFARAADADPTNADYFLGRGVALIFGEKLNDGIAALDQSAKLNRDNPLTQRWQWACNSLTGDPQLFGGTPQDEDDRLRLEMAEMYGTKALHDRQIHQTTPQDAESRAQMQRARALMPAVAARFVAQLKLSAKWGPFMSTRIVDLMNARKYALALQNIDDVYDGPGDWACCRGICLFKLGDVAGAREEFGLAVNSEALNAHAFTGRAMADARLGKAARARKDFKIAARLDPVVAAQAKEMIEEEIAACEASAPKQSAEALRAALDEAAARGESRDALKRRAIELRRAYEPTRLRYDETYSDAIDGLVARMNADDKNPEAYYALGHFILTHGLLHPEIPASDEISVFRYSYVARDDLQWAERQFDEALKLDPNHAGSLIDKATIRIRLDPKNDPVELLARAMKTGNREPKLLRMYGAALLSSALSLRFEAHGLRMPVPASGHWVSTGGDRGYFQRDMGTGYRPGPEALSRADALDKEAVTRQAEGERVAAEAVQASQGTIEGQMVDAESYYQTRHFDEAEKTYRAVLTKDQTCLLAHVRLADVCWALAHQAEQPSNGARDDAEALRWNTEAFEEQSIAYNMVHTSGKPLITLAGYRMQARDRAGAREAVLRAQKIDPTDPACPAYLAMIAKSEKAGLERLAQYRVAVALMDADAQLHGFSFSDKPDPARFHDRRKSYGHFAAIRLGQAAVLRDLGNPREALDVSNSISAMLSSIPSPTHELADEQLPWQLTVEQLERAVAGNGSFWNGSRSQQPSTP